MKSIVSERRKIEPLRLFQHVPPTFVKNDGTNSYLQIKAFLIHARVI